jgi:hypothetical protein
MFAFIQMERHAVKTDQRLLGTRLDSGLPAKTRSGQYGAFSWGDERGCLRLSEADLALRTSRRSRPSGALRWRESDA